VSLYCSVDVLCPGSVSGTVAALGETVGHSRLFAWGAQVVLIVSPSGGSACVERAALVVLGTLVSGSGCA